MFEMTTELPLWKRPGDVMMGVWNETLDLHTSPGTLGSHVAAILEEQRFSTGSLVDFRQGSLYRRGATVLGFSKGILRVRDVDGVTFGIEQKDVIE